MKLSQIQKLFRGNVQMVNEEESRRIAGHLSLSGFHEGQSVFGKVFRRYARLCCSRKFRGDPRFTSTASLHSPDIDKAPILDITKVVVYAHEPKRNHALRIITSEWANRTVGQQQAIQDSGLEFNQWRETVHSSFPNDLPLFSPLAVISNELREISFEDGLEFLAIIGAHWSYRFDPAGYIEYFQSTGWPILDARNMSDFIAQTAIMFIAMGWQVEYLVPIYWELVRKRKEIS